MFREKLIFFAVLLLGACQSEADKLQAVERGFLQLMRPLGEEALVAAGDTLWLPAVPSADAVAERTAALLALRQAAYALRPEALGEARRQRASALQSALLDLSQRGSLPAADSLHGQFARPFLELNRRDNPALTQLFLEKMPAWALRLQACPLRPALVPAALLQGTLALDALDTLAQRNPALRHSPAFNAAQAAVKDHLGWCQSAVLSVRR
jgi:hypothetical protein